jgi:hypothetical protein
MAKKTEIEVEIGSNGDVKVHVKGVKGKACLDYVEIFQKILGPLKEKSLTSEYYEAEVHTTGEIEGKVKK